MNLRKALISCIPGKTIRRSRAHGSTQAQFREEYKTFKELSETLGVDKRFDLRWADRYPCLNDRKSTTIFDRHYVYHTAWAARVVSETRPLEHVDIGSSLYFCGMLSAFIPVRFFDYRPPELQLSDLTLGQTDLLQLPFAAGTIQSLSCMHVVEHVGLGRYGDPLDPLGDHKAMKELARVLAPGGCLLFVVPVGRPRLRFNAHRIYRFRQVREAFLGLDLKEFALIPDNPVNGGLVMNPAETVVDSQNYGCGCFWFVRPHRDDSES